MDIEAVIEIPKGSRNKYEADEHGVIWLDRLLFTATQYPEDYGYVPNTLAADGDPLDVMVLHSGPTFPGCHIVVRPVGMFLMRDEEGIDAKILSVPAHDPRASDQTELEHVPDHILNEIGHFFKNLQVHRTRQVLRDHGLARPPRSRGGNPAVPRACRECALRSLTASR